MAQNRFSGGIAERQEIIAAPRGRESERAAFSLLSNRGDALESPQTIQTDQAPSPTGPFVQARRVGNLLFIAGQRGIDPDSGNLVERTIEARARRTFENLKAIAEAGGGSLATFVSTVVYVRDMDAHRPAINRLYEEYFGPNLPTRTIVEVSRLNQDDIVEIEAVVMIPGAET